MLKLELGGGDNPSKTKLWVNVDIRPLPEVDVVCDVTKLPYKDDEVDEIFAAHLIEHFGRFEFDAVLDEWVRVLKHGGKMELHCPDMEELCKQYTNGDITTEWFSYICYGGQDYEYNHHKIAWDYSRLRSELVQRKMTNVTREPVKTLEDAAGEAYCPILVIKATKL